MADKVAGFPYWELTFDENGNFVPPEQEQAFLTDVPGQLLTDLFFFSHGWNNDRAMAHTMYDQFFQLIRSLVDDPHLSIPGSRVIGLAGVIWPSRMWADEMVPTPSAGGAAGLVTPPTDAELVLDLKPLFPAPEQQAALDEMARLLGEKPPDAQQLTRFQQLMRTLNTSPDADPAPEDNGEAHGLLDEDPIVVFQRFAGVAQSGQHHGGAAGLGDPFTWLWNGAKQALREVTYWQMKKRAGTVGQNGLGPLIGKLAATQSSLRVHLMGHSFGARLVSFAIKGLPADALKPASTLKSVSLLQGAFSHFAFTDSLPMHPGQQGALAGALQRIDGPLVATYSVHDMAVGWLYPMASLASGDNASALQDQLYEWGAMGHDGAQAVHATDVPIAAVGQKYAFGTGACNLNGNNIIVQGGPPSGAHGDIFHPEIAWAVLTAAGVTKVSS